MHLEWHPPVEARGRSPLKGARVVQVKVQYNGLCKFKYDFTRSNTRTTTLTCHKMKNRQHTKSHTQTRSAMYVGALYHVWKQPCAPPMFEAAAGTAAYAYVYVAQCRCSETPLQTSSAQSGVDWLPSARECGSETEKRCASLSSTNS